MARPLIVDHVVLDVEHGLQLYASEQRVYSFKPAKGTMYVR